MCSQVVGSHQRHRTGVFILCGYRLNFNLEEEGNKIYIYCLLWKVNALLQFYLRSYPWDAVVEPYSKDSPVTKTRDFTFIGTGN